MKILLLAPQSFYIERGTPIDVDLLLRALSNRGESVDTVVYHSGQDRRYPGVRLHRIRQPLSIGIVKPGFSFQKLLCDWSLLRTAVGLVRKHTFDVVHAVEESVFVAMWLRRSFGTPYVYDMDSSIAHQMVEQMRLFQPLSGGLSWCETQAIRGALAVAPVCDTLADIALSKGARRVETLHDISQLGDSPGRKNSGLRGLLDITGQIVLYVGNLEKYQGIGLILESFAVACRTENKLNLVIAGGSERQIWRYRKRAHRLGVASKTHFIGQWPFDRLGELLAEASILVVPRIKGLNTPMKLFPFLHSGRPVLVTDLPMHNRLLDRSIAELAAAEPEEFGRALASLAADPERQQVLGRAGRSFVEKNHTFRAHQARVDRLYDWIGSTLNAQHGADPRVGSRKP